MKWRRKSAVAESACHAPSVGVLVVGMGVAGGGVDSIGGVGGLAVWALGAPRMRSGAIRYCKRFSSRRPSLNRAATRSWVAKSRPVPGRPSGPKWRAARREDAAVSR